MKQTFEFIPTYKDVTSDAVINSHRILLKGGYAHAIAAGVYTYLPLSQRIIRKISNICREEFEKINCTELHMPVLIPKTLWEESTRWDDYGSNLMRITDRHDREFCLGPTHEEVITEIVRTHISSYKKLPLGLFQIQTKFRDEHRPRYGLMRGREFIMKDLYTFHETSECLQEWYDKVSQAYYNIFNRCGLNFVRIEADNGDMGGDSSHEFMALCDVGEDTITYCDKCGYSANQEVSGLKEGDKCPKCTASIKEAKGIELGHIFQLGTKYSEAMKAYINTKDGKSIPMLMGCYGIGISRVVMAIIEQYSNEDKSMVWPEEVTPYDVHIIMSNCNDEAQINFANEFEELLKSKGLDVLVDNRDERIGSKLKDADLIGIPRKYILGRDFVNGEVEFRDGNDSPVNLKIEDIIGQ